MRKLFIAQIMDSLSESIIATFTASNLRMVDSQFKGFLKDCKSKGIALDSFTCVVVGQVEVFEVYKDLENYASEDVCCPADYIFTAMDSDHIDLE